MDRCPLEICTHIFSYACTDGGKTGRSLSLVSRYVSRATDPVRLQSLTVCGRKLRTFLEMLDSIRPEVQRARHLYLSDVEEEVTERILVLNTRKKMLARTDPLAQAGRDIRNLEDSELKSIMSKCYEDEEEDSLVACIIRILESNASTLRTLTISLMHLQGYLVFPTHLPFLLDLSLISLATGGHANLHLTDTELPSLPSLKRLHVANAQYIRHFVTLVSQFLSSLTHLRITGGSYRAFLGSLSTSGVKKVLIQPGPAPVGLRLQVKYMQHHRRLLEDVAKFRDHVNDSDLRIIMLKERNMEDWRTGEIEFLRYGIQEALRDWALVAAGEESFWDIKDEDPKETRQYQYMLDQFRRISDSS